MSLGLVGGGLSTLPMPRKPARYSVDRRAPRPGFNDDPLRRATGVPSGRTKLPGGRAKPHVEGRDIPGCSERFEDLLQPSLQPLSDGLDIAVVPPRDRRDVRSTAAILASPDTQEGRIGGFRPADRETPVAGGDAESERIQFANGRRDSDPPGMGASRIQRRRLSVHAGGSSLNWRSQPCSDDLGQELPLAAADTRPSISALGTNTRRIAIRGIRAGTKNSTWPARDR